jgi:predicted TPR repeat methyltransferase
MRGYVSRWDFVLNKCTRKSVLHLGCVGITEGTLDDKLRAWRQEGVIHIHLQKVCKYIVGVDHDEVAILALRKMGYERLLVGDVTNLRSLSIDRRFDIILCGDIIEHLSNPGLMLEGVKAFMGAESEILITTPNAFGLLHFVRHLAGRFSEGSDHVVSFQVYTLLNLLERHGFCAQEILTGYNRPPAHLVDFIRVAVGIPFFRLFPSLGGTLLVIAKKKTC